MSAHDSDSSADGKLEKCDGALPTFQQAGDSARGDGRHAEAEGHKSEQQQVSLQPHFSCRKKVELESEGERSLL